MVKIMFIHSDKAERCFKKNINVMKNILVFLGMVIGIPLIMFYMFYIVIPEIILFLK